MLNKEDILALAWEHSEGSGKRYTFTEENLFAFLGEVNKQSTSLQAESANVMQYYYRVNGCDAATSKSEDCICWHDQGTGPYPKAVLGDEVVTGVALAWREKPEQTSSATAQDEREAFEAVYPELVSRCRWDEAKQKYCSGSKGLGWQDGLMADQWLAVWKKARTTRPAQTEQQPEQSEREAFESRMMLECGPTAIDLWISGNPDAGYSNERVNDYRFGWVACLEWVKGQQSNKN